MTPKETAKELVQKYLYKCIEYAYAESKYKYLAKQCALICVENEYSEKSKLLETLGCYITTEEFQYEFAKIEDDYNEVKQEINNL